MLARLEALERWEEAYRHRQGPSIPILVRAVLREGSPVAAYDRVNLDNLLARTVLAEATRGELIGNPPEGSAGWHLPVPLVRLWESSTGCPLWASSVFWPLPSAGTHAVGDTLYWHKRMPSARWARGEGKGGRMQVINATTGRWMEQRTPVPVTLCDVWQARGWGDAAEVARLLRQVSFIGKRRAIGLGEVRRWEVITGDRGEGTGDRGEGMSAIGTICAEGRLLRPVPAEASGALGLRVEDAPVLVGWTPPQWSPRLLAPGWRTGTACTMLRG